MTELHIVTGAGPVGTTVAEQLAEIRHTVRVLTRSGGGPDHPLVERRRVDVTDPAQLAGQFDGAAAVYHCVHASKYEAKTWWAELPSTEQLVLAEAGRADTVVAFPESVYSYGKVFGRIGEDMPRTADFGKPAVRAALLRAREAHATPTVSIAAADFLGPHVLSSVAGENLFEPLVAGRRGRALGRLDVPHSFTYVPDLAAAMIAAAADRALWNSFLHAPTASAITQRELVAMIGAAAGVDKPGVMTLTPWMIKSLGLVSPMMRSMAEMSYHLGGPVEFDSTASERRLGLAPTPLEQAVAATVAWWKTRR
ncbi:NAD-dependent epimerase/dehydratase family protein [Nocardia arizonensis]|uniref:NAD-dependent epimerase/dehydratase family protein n=1 Tax=Nocardia arizonensis TaxID=1141647 RepID=UPI0006D119DE|nr:NAD-dependent epimerase/dehydratase family protein [Nocardia arizonensis]